MVAVREAGLPLQKTSPLVGTGDIPATSFTYRSVQSVLMLLNRGNCSERLRLPWWMEKRSEATRMSYHLS